MLECAQKRKKCVWYISLLQITLVLFASSNIPASSLLLCMWPQMSLPSIVLFLQDLLHVPETFLWNLPGYWVPACTWQSAGCPLEHGRWRLSTVFHLHFLPLKIAAVMHELIKPLAIKLSHFQFCGYQHLQQENISKIPWLKQWDRRSCMCEP